MQRKVRLFDDKNKKEITAILHIIKTQDDKTLEQVKVN